MQSLQELGWSDFFAQSLEPGEEPSVGRVVADHRSLFRVQTSLGECAARVSGRLRHEATGRADLPSVGDWTVLDGASPASEAVIRRILPRKSKFSRKAAGDETQEQIVAANIDVVWIVTSLDHDFSPRRIERYLALAWQSGAAPAIVLTKADLCPETDQRREEAEAIAWGTPVHVVSALAGLGLDGLRPHLANHATVALLGSSGVGKSTLINALAETPLQRTAAVREEDSKGRHTTTHRQLIRLSGGGLIVDTPGMRELQLWDAEQGVQDTFVEIEELGQSCRFGDCRHQGEPGCAIAVAIEQGTLSQERLDSFHKLQRELAHLDRKQDVRAQAEQKKQWKSIHKSLKHHPKYRRQ